MWAQLVKMHSKDGSEGALENLERQWEESVGRATDSGWMRTMAFTSTENPRDAYLLVMFESEEKARANENSPQHQEFLSKMMDAVDGTPEYVDLTPIYESSR